jgi:sporulation integral membrane protein YlbJ
MKIRNWMLALVAALLMTGFAVQPVVALQSAREGLNLFLSVVLPSILPFMVCANLFIESGAAAAAGRVLNGLMRPLFACPGEAAFALTAGILSGYPMGARVALDLHEKKLINEDDAARTGILASCCGPVFMLGAIGAGLLGNPAAGWLIAASQYCAVLITGFLFSIGGNRSRGKTHAIAPQEGISVMAALGNSIKKTVDTLWAVGGYIILFSVVSALLKHYNAFVIVDTLASPVLKLFKMEPTLAQPLAIGVIEMTNGCNAVASAAATLQNRCAAMAMLVSFGGLCIQAQSMLFLTGVKLSVWKFMLSKTVQAVVAFAACRLLAMLPVFSSVLCMGTTGGQGLSAASTLITSAAYTAGAMLVFVALALFSGRASTRGSA